MAQPIPFRRKIPVVTGKRIKDQIGQAQRGQWLYLDGGNARLVNLTDRVTIMRVNRDGSRDICQYA